MNKMLIVDPNKCTGCRACETACSTFHESESSFYKSRIRVIRFPEELFFYPLVCQQCQTPLCAVPCPTTALEKNARTGQVDFSAEKCVGCKLCLTACPLGAMALVDSMPAKCDLCQGEPACVKLCEPGAIVWGEAESIVENQNLFLAEKVRATFLRKGSPQG